MSQNKRKTRSSKDDDGVEDFSSKKNKSSNGQELIQGRRPSKTPRRHQNETAPSPPPRSRNGNEFQYTPPPPPPGNEFQHPGSAQYTPPPPWPWQTVNYPQISPSSITTGPPYIAPAGISSSDNSAVEVNFVKGIGKYTMQLTRVSVENTIEEKARTAALLFSQADVLRELGDHLLSQIRASVKSDCYQSLNINK